MNSKEKNFMIVLLCYLISFAVLILKDINPLFDKKNQEKMYKKSTVTDFVAISAILF